MFIGQGRSGHSVIGSLLDAHKNAVIAHEFDIVKYLLKSRCPDMNKRELTEKFIERSQDLAKREKGGYEYILENQWNGNFDDLFVLGDKQGEATTDLSRGDMSVFSLVKEFVGVQIKVFHVVRNPFANISSLWSRPISSSLEYKSIEGLIEHFFAKSKINETLKKKLQDADGFEYYELKHEDFIKNPKDNLEKICNFLELPIIEDYLDDCCSIVFDKPRERRRLTCPCGHSMNWNDKEIDLVNEHIKNFSFLEGYSFWE